MTNILFNHQPALLYNICVNEYIKYINILYIKTMESLYLEAKKLSGPFRDTGSDQIYSSYTHPDFKFDGCRDTMQRLDQLGVLLALSSSPRPPSRGPFGPWRSSNLPTTVWRRSCS